MSMLCSGVTVTGPMWSAKHQAPTVRRPRRGSTRRTGSEPTVVNRPSTTSTRGAARLGASLPGSAGWAGMSVTSTGPLIRPPPRPPPNTVPASPAQTSSVRRVRNAAQGDRVDAPMTPGIDIRRADERFATQIDWLDSKHSFSFGHHYDASNTHHGLLLVNNDDIVAPGTGFETHPHRDMEIVTWVLRGQLVHQDSEGHNGVIYPGLAQRMSAGKGILHSEKNDAWKVAEASADAAQDPVHFVQMWVVPDEGGIAPGYEQLEIDAELLAGGLVPVASGMPQHDGASAIRIKNKYAALHVARLQPGGTVLLPDAPFLHLFLPRGSVTLEGAGDLGAGDAVRFSRTGGHRVTAVEPAEILVWEMHAALAA